MIFIEWRIQRMAIPIGINELINGQIVESNRIEFKADLNPTSILHSICAFANDIDNIGGGYIVIGVEEENGTPKFPIKGIERDRIDGLLKRLLELCHFIEPFYEPQAEPMLYEGKYVIVLWCSGGFGRPYKASKDAIQHQSNKYYYIRKFSSSVIASNDEEKELFLISEDIPFDDRPNLAASPEDLNIGLICDHLQKTGSSLAGNLDGKKLNELADDLQLLEGPPENRKPRNVGLLMFGSNPQKYFRYARIEVVSIPDPTGLKMTEKIFSGTLQFQLHTALEYIKASALEERVIKHSDRAEADRIWNYPYRAIEEILSNAVYHRSYQVREPITVRITSAEIEITSFPGFQRSITDDDIAKGIIRGKFYRNRRIGDFMKELGLIEGRNTGFPNAYNALRHNGSPTLRFKMDPERSYLSVIIPIHHEFASGAYLRQMKYQEKILSVLGNESLTLTEISKAMRYKGITQKLRDSIQVMVSNGALDTSIGANKQILYRKK